MDATMLQEYLRINSSINAFHSPIYFNKMLYTIWLQSSPTRACILSSIEPKHHSTFGYFIIQKRFLVYSHTQINFRVHSKGIICIREILYLFLSFQKMMMLKNENSKWVLSENSLWKIPQLNRKNSMFIIRIPNSG